MICYNCKKQMSDAYVYDKCPFCGVDLRPGAEEKAKPQEITLINCPACGNQVSNQAFSCPKCGHPLKSQEEILQQKRAIEQDYSSDDGSYGGGFALGLFLGIIGLIIALTGGKSETKRGAILGFILQAIVGVILALAFSS